MTVCLQLLILAHTVRTSTVILKEHTAMQFLHKNRSVPVNAKHRAN